MRADKTDYCKQKKSSSLYLEESDAGSTLPCTRGLSKGDRNSLETIVVSVTTSRITYALTSSMSGDSSTLRGDSSGRLAGERVPGAGAAAARRGVCSARCCSARARSLK